LEAALRRSLLLSAGDPLIFITRPISAVLMLISFFLLIFPLIPRLGKKRTGLPLGELEDGR
jgi:TctA family transporter